MTLARGPAGIQNGRMDRARAVCQFVDCSNTFELLPESHRGTQKRYCSPVCRSRAAGRRSWPRRAVPKDAREQVSLRGLRAVLVEEQLGNCALCSKPLDLDDLHTDHDHDHCERDSRGVRRACRASVRGVIHRKCNFWLGWLRWATNEGIVDATESYLSRAA